MEEIVRKAMRMRKPRYVNVQLRSEVYDYLSDLSLELTTSVPVLCRGVLEDFYDAHFQNRGDLDG